MRIPNPYVTLGLPYGAGGIEAQAAFAREAKALRRVEGGRGRLVELTGALHAIQTKLADGRPDITTYRLPVEPDDPTSPDGGPGIFRPLPEPLPPRPGDPAPLLQRLRNAAALEYLRHLAERHSAAAGLPEP